MLIPLAGEVLLAGGDRCVERLAPGVLATVPAYERVSVENPSMEPASMLVCFGPGTFVETLPGAAAAGASC